jgi:CBS domain-containing protein
MKTCDIMSQEVISIRPTATIAEAIKLMLENDISGLPVIDANGMLVGIVTEGDFLRRAELGTHKKRPRWLKFLFGPDFVASEYIAAHTRRVADVMTKTVIVVDEDTDLRDVVRVMETNGIKRLPVMRGSAVVGVVSRANLLHALAALQPSHNARTGDADIRRALLAEIRQNLTGLGRLNITVRDGVVDLWGTVFSNPAALCVAAENTPGVHEVHNHLVWVEPYSGALIANDAGTRRWDA